MNAVRRPSILCSIALCLVGCATSARSPAFDSRFADRDAAGLKRILARLAASKPSETAGDALVVAITDAAQPELVAYDLALQRVRWRSALHATSRPEVSGDLVLATAGDRLVGFNVTDGTRRFDADVRDCNYVGASRAGARVFFTCNAGHAANASSARASRVVAIDASSGRVLWQRAAPGMLGRPTARAGLVLLPWQGQNLVILDARNGREVLRLHSRSDVIDWLFDGEGGVVFGRNAFHRLSPSSYPGLPDSTASVALQNAALPGRPPVMESAFVARSGSRSAQGRVALHVLPETVGEHDVRIAGDRYYLVFFRYVFAFDTTGALRWTRLMSQDAIAGRALPSGLSLLSERGELLHLAAQDGATLSQAQLGSQLASASLSGSAPGNLAQAQPTTLPLRDGLKAIALDNDTRLVPARAYAVTQLATLNDPAITGDLLQIYRQSATAPELARVVADALRTRRTGIEHLIDALAERYDFLDQTRPGPLAVIVPALIEARDARAVPNLTARLFDHETPTAALPLLARAIATLGDASVVPALHSWLRLYRADSTVAQAPDAFLEAARGVVVHGGPQGPELLAPLVTDKRTHVALAEPLHALLRSRQAPSPVAPSLVVAQQKPAPELPDSLAQASIHATFAQHADYMRTCVLHELARDPLLLQVRIAFVAEHDGSAHAFTFAPNTPAFVDCMYPLVASYRFPAFRSGRHVATYMISLRKAAAPKPHPAGEQPWWTNRQQRWQAKVDPAIKPWWLSAQPVVPMMLPKATSTAAPPAAATAQDTWWAPAARTSQAATPEAPTPSEPPKPAPPAEDVWWTPKPSP